jgi:hypothetical protein
MLGTHALSSPSVPESSLLCTVVCSTTGVGSTFAEHFNVEPRCGNGCSFCAWTEIYFANNRMGECSFFGEASSMIADLPSCSVHQAALCKVCWEGFLFGVMDVTVC